MNIGGGGSSSSSSKQWVGILSDVYGPSISLD